MKLNKRMNWIDTTIVVQLIPLQIISTKTGNGIRDALTDVIAYPELGISKSQCLTYLN